MLYDTIPGNVELIDNIFENTSYAEEPACQLNVPYDYENILDLTADLPTLIPPNIRKAVINGPVSVKNYFTGFELNSYPNPAGSFTDIVFKLPENTEISVNLYSLTGHHLQTIANGLYEAGKHKITVNLDAYGPGVYFYKLSSSKASLIKKLVIN